MNLLVDELVALTAGRRPTELPLWHRSRYAGLERIRACLRTLAMGGQHDAMLGFVAGFDQAEYAAQLLAAEGLTPTLIPNGANGMLHLKWADAPSVRGHAAASDSRPPDVIVDVFWNLKTSRSPQAGKT